MRSATLFRSGADSVSDLAVPLAAAQAHALHHLSPENDRPHTASLSTLRARLDLPLNSSGMEPLAVIDELVAAVEGGIVNSAGGRFFGWVVGGTLPAALAADWLTSAWDQNAANFTHAPAAAVVEETAGRWLKQILQLPVTASFALVTGCQMAHVTCLAAARYALLERSGWNVEADGLSGAPPIRILTSSERHGSLVRATRLLGLGERNIIALPADAQGRLTEETLEQALASAPTVPTIVVLQAGDLNIGAYDPFSALIPIAKRYGAWVHIDGAFGLWAAGSPRFSHLLEGAEQADSWATDGHKWLNVPYDCGYAFVADPQTHRAALSYRGAPYLTHDDDARDQMDWNPEWSRRARGFSTYAALRQLGTAGVADLIERTCDHAHALVLALAALPGVELLWEPRINQGLVRFLDPAPGATEPDHDRYTDLIIAAIVATGEAFFTGTTWRGQRAMRVSVCNWQTSTADITRTCQAVAAVLSVTSRDA